MYIGIILFYIVHLFLYFTSVADSTLVFALRWLRKVGMSMNSNEELLTGNADADACYPDSDPDVT